jgi:uncharacterized protein
MFIDINTLGPEGLAFEKSIRLDGLEGPSREPIPDIEAKLAGTVAPTSRGADLRAHLDTTVPLTCGRCLETFSWGVHSDFELAVRRTADEPRAETGSDENDDDGDAVQAPEGRLELEDVAREQLYLSLPLKPICNPACQGLCPMCGVNRNLTRCGCVHEDVDPRLAPLLQFRSKKKDS